ncbi:hypothetical protein J2Y45_002987 [Dyadobacter sp. BE34]|uniref:DUF4249 domain-containing protein n=1 Tax=Dyadobacter fermentans TaxID=94254 RepID=A0ABU1QU75_9BACT|nr:MULTISPECIES: DUF4249 domain-containing protein [Dyadobacter]MDR6804705.1 hypothetical protein [Dyadobacter fermentans]MDR7043536.1 hypothetical protein [Dyadobacter sp. BE242]MDR7197848.1 hypothetical protein [Dyadobacter sp. BE34]MDR7214719.1 hypothetical protein [Dyadobacter sp. BE31]MDR7262254.1 hypothetical protein [Dyadobacter sp. BE32]
MMKTSVWMLAFCVTSFYSCQKVIEVKLNPSSPRYVITGNITDQPGPYEVKMTSSIHFDQDNNFPAVSGAKVYITDQNAGLTDTLTEVTPGRYLTHVLAGVPGHTYKMVVMLGNETFSSVSTMPPPIALDSLYTKAATFGDGTDVVALYDDPVARGNFYHLVLAVQDRPSREIYLHNDKINNGATVTHVLNNDVDIRRGDIITVSLQCIDTDVYDFYYSLDQALKQNSAVISNPKTNIRGGAMGYFSAHTTRTRSFAY